MQKLAEGGLGEPRAGVLSGVWAPAHLARAVRGLLLRTRSAGLSIRPAGCMRVSHAFLATRAGVDVARAQRRGLGWDVTSVLAGARIRAVASEGGARAFAGGDGLWSSDDGGATWRRAGLEGHEVTAIAARGDIVVAGTKPVGVWSSTDGGASWRDARLPRAWWWWTPSESPLTPYVQAVAISAAAIVVGIEVGGVLTSRDGGASWTRARGALLDRHSLAADPFDPERFWQGGAGTTHGATSADGGRTWRKIKGVRGRRYGWAAAADGEG